MTIQYKNFRIEIRKTSGELYAIPNSECTQQVLENVSFTMDLTPAELKQISEKTVMPVGKRLYRSIFHAPSKQFGDDEILPGDTLHVRLAVDRELIKRQKDHGLRLIFRASADAIPDNPVELLCCRYTVSENGSFLALDPRTSIVRMPITTADLGKAEIPFPLRILVVLCRTKLSPDFRPEEEKQLLQEKFKGFEHIAVDFVGTEGDPPATWQVVRERLEGHNLPPRAGFPLHYSIFHFIGHGEFEEARSEGILILDKGDNSPYRLPGHRLRDVLKNASNVKMVILQSCRTAATDPTYAFHGIAQKLAEAAMPCVIAMQYQITPKAAQTFVAHLYEWWLLNGMPLEEAVTAARRMLHEEIADGNIEDPLAWAAPVLFLTSTISVVRGRPILPDERQKQAEKLRAQIAGFEERINELEAVLSRPLLPEKKQEAEITKKYLESERDKAETHLMAALGTFIDVHNARREFPEAQTVEMPVCLYVHGHQPTRAEFEIEYDSTRAELENVVATGQNYLIHHLQSPGRVRISVQGVNGEIERNNGEIGRLVFRLGSNPKTMQVSPASVKIYEDNQLVSEQSPYGWIIV